MKFRASPQVAGLGAEIEPAPSISQAARLASRHAIGVMPIDKL